MPYVDGFVLAVPKDKIEAYKALARTACAVWMEHGALDYIECIGDDVPYGELTSFPRAVMAKEDEVVVFSWIIYRDRETRDDVNKKVMADARLKGGDMSGGERQMLAVGRALMSDPKLLMLDEPSLGLAPAVVESMYETFGRLHREGLTILLAEQSIELALEVSDFATVLQVGKSVLSGTAAALAEDPQVQKAYLGVD